MHREDNKTQRHLIASYVEPRALELPARAALAGLGYRIVQASTIGRFDKIDWNPRVRLVDERHFHRIPSPAEDPTTPIILLTGQRPSNIEDDRVRGRVMRPASLASLYPLLQACLEMTPRMAPRVDTLLSARISKNDKRWLGSVTSLSQNGCLLRTSEPIAAGTRVNLHFALPKSDFITTRAECVHRSNRGLGLVFHETPGPVRDSINGFVAQRLATLEAIH